MPSTIFGRSSKLQIENKRKQNDKQVPGRCQRTKNLLDMKVLMIPMVVGALGTVPKGLDKILVESEIRGTIETIKTTAMRLVRIPGKVLEIWENLLSFRLQKNPPTVAGVKNSQGVKLTDKWKWENFVWCDESSAGIKPQWYQTMTPRRPLLSVSRWEHLTWNVL